MEPRQLYIKTNRAESAPSDVLHIHVDAQEEFSDITIQELLGLGFYKALFDHTWQVLGKNGDPTLPFDHHEPKVHLSFSTSSLTKYKEVWKKTVALIEQSGVPAYVEGELIVLDQPLPSKPFDEGVFKKLLPTMVAEQPAFAYRSAIDGHLHLLPALVKIRCLDPEKNGRQDRFRRGEAHLTVREDIDPRLLELLCNLGFGAPAIPKLVEGEDGKLKRNVDGSFVIIRDIPLTLQTLNMRALLRVTNLVVSLIEAIGGIRDGSIKLELATHFAVLNGVDYQTSIPPVLDTAEFHPNFAYLDQNHLGSQVINLGELTKKTRNRARTAVHVDKTELFCRIWERTNGGKKE